MWFAAHILMVHRLREGPQDEFSAWENIVLIEAAGWDDAQEKAEQRGRDSAHDDPTQTHGGKPSRTDFAGVRKVVSCDESEQQPVHGIEVSYNHLVFGSEADVKRFVDGEEVGAVFQDEKPVSLDDL